MSGLGYRQLEIVHLHQTFLIIYHLLVFRNLELPTNLFLDGERQDNIMPGYYARGLYFLQSSYKNQGRSECRR